MQIAQNSRPAVVYYFHKIKGLFFKKNPLRLQNPFTAFQGLGDFKVGINRKKFDRSVPFSSLTFEQIKLIHELIGIFIWPKNELKAYNEISPFAKRS